MEFAIPMMNKNEPLTAEPAYYRDWLSYDGKELGLNSEPTMAPTVPTPLILS